MTQDRFNLNSRTLLLAAIAAAYPVVGYTAPAARVDFAVGNVTATGANGQSRALARGAQVEQGDTVNTNGGRAQLQFSDGAFVSLQPESQFRIDQYRYDGKQDGNEKGFFSLLKGGLRTITGLVGRTNKANYQVTTSVATIGIRGTEYTIEYGHSVTGSVGEGEINVCNTAGCQSVVNGESYYVKSQDTKPIITSKKTDLPPPPPTTTPTHFNGGESTDAGTLPGIVLTGTQTLNTVTVSCPDGCFQPSSSNKVVELDSSGKLITFNGVTATNVQMGGNDGIIAWGTFADSSNSTVHFVVGAPTASSELQSLQLARTVASYSLIGSTPVTNSSNQQIGTLNSASLTIDFGNSGAATVPMTWTLNGASYNKTLTGYTNGAAQFSMAVGGNVFSGCNTVCASVGLFGPNAIRAGMSYQINDPNANLNAVGAAAFAKK